MKTLVALVLLAALSIAPRVVRADDAAAKRDADALFFEAKRLMKSNKTAAACFKFEESLAKLEQLGVKLNLADCYEQAGRSASALRTYRSFADQADKAGDKRAAYARTRADALESKVAHLVIKAPPGATALVDGVTQGDVATALPVDPGPHEVV